ncbi:hypothetical protein NKG05_17340 [Oerskovia sp. M15]
MHLSQREVGLYVYPKKDADRPASWENSGEQTLVAHRPGDKWYTTFPGVLPDFVCGDGWAVQQDRVRQDGTFEWPETITPPATKLDGVLVEARHQEVEQLGVEIPECVDEPGTDLPEIDEPVIDEPEAPVEEVPEVQEPVVVTRLRRRRRGVRGRRQRRRRPGGHRRARLRALRRLRRRDPLPGFVLAEDLAATSSPRTARPRRSRWRSCRPRVTAPWSPATSRASASPTPLPGLRGLPPRGLRGRGRPPADHHVPAPRGWRGLRRR